jgi:chromosomal replication initiation ATPase DnaA
VNISEQLPFDFNHRPSVSGDDFLVSISNKDAVAWIDQWSIWPSPFLVIYGLPGSGKTHLCNVFMEETGARLLSASMLSTAGLPSLLSTSENFILDDNNINLNEDFEESLFHIYNDLSSRRGRMLITSVAPPSDWSIKLVDLASRLKASPAVSIGMPDDDLIKAVLVKLFSDRQLRVEIGVIDYVLNRIERSLGAARHFVEIADKRALIEKKSITLTLVRQVLHDLVR